jgi:hypothetical protein
MYIYILLTEKDCDRLHDKQNLNCLDYNQNLVKTDWPTDRQL